MYTVKIMEQEECLKRWGEIEPCLAKALVHSRGEWTPTEIMREVMRDPTQFHIWDIKANTGETVAFGSTRINRYNRYSSLHVITLANVEGNKALFKDYIGIVSKVEEKAKEAGLQRMEFTGRKGWLKVLNKVGYNEQYVTMDKEL